MMKKKMVTSVFVKYLILSYFSDSSNDEVVAGRKRPVDSPPKKLAKTRKIGMTCLVG